jgi:hypothetical protein
VRAAERLKKRGEQRAAQREREAERERAQAERLAEELRRIHAQYRQSQFRAEQQANRRDIAEMQRAATDLQREFTRERYTLLANPQASRERLLGNWADANRDFHASFAQGVDEVIEATTRLNQALEKTGGTALSMGQAVQASVSAVAQDVARNIGQTATSAVQTHVAAWVSGQKTIGQAAKAIVKDVLQSVVAESIVRVVFETASGIASAARYDFVAAGQHFAAAGVYAAVAGVAGGVSAGLGGGGGGSGAAGGASARGGTAPLAPPAPDDDRDSEPRTIVVNVGTFPVSTDRDVGFAVSRALEAFQRGG